MQKRNSNMVPLIQDALIKNLSRWAAHDPGVQPTKRAAMQHSLMIHLATKVLEWQKKPHRNFRTIA